ncbi:MAG: nucleotidyltransferase domain-containing protein [Acidobacteria bacterium]|nr:nucleotidyltransferase domain-containing protein [Acidobacteriota bacterium]
MAVTIADDLAEVRRIVLDKLGGLPARIVLFGSRARGDARRGSDIDIALEAAAPLPIELLAEIRDALEDSRVLPRVDVVDLMRASAELRRRVREEGIQWTG